LAPAAASGRRRRGRGGRNGITWLPGPAFPVANVVKLFFIANDAPAEYAS